MGKKHHKDIPAEIPENDLPEPTPADDGASDDGMPVADDDDDDGRVEGQNPFST